MSCAAPAHARTLWAATLLCAWATEVHLRTVQLGCCMLLRRALITCGRMLMSRTDAQSSRTACYFLLDFSSQHAWRAQVTSRQQARSLRDLSWLRRRAAAARGRDDAGRGGGSRARGAGGRLRSLPRPRQPGARLGTASCKCAPPSNPGAGYRLVLGGGCCSHPGAVSRRAAQRLHARARQDRVYGRDARRHDGAGARPRARRRQCSSCCGWRACWTRCRCRPAARRPRWWPRGCPSAPRCRSARRAALQSTP